MVSASARPVHGAGRSFASQRRHPAGDDYMFCSSALGPYSAGTGTSSMRR